MLTTTLPQPFLRHRRRLQTELEVKYEASFRDQCSSFRDGLGKNNETKTFFALKLGSSWLPQSPAPEAREPPERPGHRLSNLDRSENSWARHESLPGTPSPGAP